MRLRVRLTLALTALAAVGLVIFGFSTYTLYARSQYSSLDEQLRSSVLPVTVSLFDQAGVGGPRPGSDQPASGGDQGQLGGQPPDDNRPAPPVVAPTGTYGELRDDNGIVLSRVQLSDSSTQPDIPVDLGPVADDPRLFDTGSVEGPTRWRVFAGPVDGRSGRVAVVAVPLAEVAESLRRLVLIETAAGATLLVLLASGSWLILRRGLRPLERMASKARSIRAGDLSERVEPADDHSEVGELGLALNTMLEDLEGSFAERSATERRLRQFLADASHELRTPLTSIQGFAELFRLGQDRPDAAKDIDLPIILRRIEEELERVKGVDFADPGDDHRDSKLKEIEERAKAARNTQKQHTPEGMGSSFITPESGRGLARGLQIAYAIIGVPLVGFGVGWLIDRQSGGVLWQGVGTILGAAIAVIYAIKSTSQK